jgi:DNA-binding response OmpR family regulator
MSLKIMIVDDDPAILTMLKTMVEPQGCEVFTVQDSRLAAKLIGRKKFDGIFLDAGMPHVDGFQLTQCIRESPSNKTVPIVMITGNDDVETMRKGFKAGITLFIGKPVTPKRLGHIMNALRGAFVREKRRYARMTLRAPVLCRWNSPEARQGKFESLDISEAGMAMFKAEGVNVGQPVSLEFGLPGEPAPMKIGGKIVRQMPPDAIAVVFVDPPSEHLLAIQRYVLGMINA